MTLCYSDVLQSYIRIMLCNDPFQCGVPGQKDHQVPDTMSCNNYLKLSILIRRSEVYWKMYYCIISPDLLCSL